MENKLLVQQFEFNKEMLLDYTMFSHKDNFPSVYILHNNNTVYIGETISITRRFKEHLKNKNKLKLTEVILFSHERFNKSAVYNIETNLINYFIADNKYTWQNRSQVKQKEVHDYYQKEYYNTYLFEQIWEWLIKNSIVTNDLKTIKNKDVYKISPFKELSYKQSELKEEIIHFCEELMKDDLQKNSFLVKGEAGTGKSVVLSSIFFTIEDMSKNSASVLYNTNNYLLMNHSEMLKTYHSLSSKTAILKKKSFMKPTSFINKMKKENRKADIVFIDEAHLLLSQKDKYNSFSEKNHLAEVLKYTKAVILIYDDKQVLRLKSYWNSKSLKEILQKKIYQEVNLIEQFRMQADTTIVQWINKFIYETIGDIPVKQVQENTQEYDIKIFSNLKDMHQEIIEKNRCYGLSRVVSTFDYEHKKDGEDYYVSDNHYKIPWNRGYKDSAWAEVEGTEMEVGSIYTVQGFDLNYVGVVLGPSISYNQIENKLEVDIEKYKDTEAFKVRKDLTSTQIKNAKKQIVLNSLNVLMKRGTRGLYIFASNKELKEKLLKSNIIEV